MARPTINHVATLAGVSKKTVSFVLNGHAGVAPGTQARVRAAMAQLGFAPNAQARSLAQGCDASVVLAYSADFAPILADAVRGALRAVQGARMVLIVCEGERGLAAVLEERKPRAIVALGMAQAPSPALIVTADASPVGIRIPARQCAADAAHYLLALGHKRIALACGPEDEAMSLEHERGLAEVAGEAPLLVANGDGSIAAGREAAEALLDLSPTPTAILAASGEMALGILHAARERGLAVPRDLSVIALTDGPLAEHAEPAVSALRIDWTALVEDAVKRALDHDAPRQELYPRLIVRASTAPPNAT